MIHDMSESICTFDTLSSADVRPWGSFTDLADADGAWHIKVICIHAGERLSLQRHFHRDEHWVVLDGEIEATLDDDVRILVKGEHVFVPRETRHRIYAVTDAVIGEMSVGRVDENDIERIEDDYGRVL
jgi:mannose-1-phosphate guanylyltransferase